MGCNPNDGPLATGQLRPELAPGRAGRAGRAERAGRTEPTGQLVRRADHPNGASFRPASVGPSVGRSAGAAADRRARWTFMISRSVDRSTGKSVRRSADLTGGHSGHWFVVLSVSPSVADGYFVQPDGRSLPVRR